ncbi:hypothetical protein M2338_002910 [Sphingobium sp. B2D3B]|uniref:ogr/Delta-like zinc finger family protein n=1 Tax=Sphingobium sp. B2D3B TaxID=2940580 RepID=UPI0022240AE9|nr:ogr/Delta-like zinc finger family protein [Sphingobium sp. B2D3B]MCW2383345.1 hypothetical protein [Sphingobium sp. B2D3B]
MLARENHRMPGASCPACGSGAKARRVGKVALTYREIYYHCRDELGCGHVFVAELTAIRTVRVSQRNPPIHPLPISEWRRGPANDDSPNPEPNAGALKA